MSKPFVHRASTDEINLLGNVERLLTTIGKAFSSGFPRDVQMAAAEVSTSITFFEVNNVF
jgi:hypothetical protein